MDEETEARGNCIKEKKRERKKERKKRSAYKALV
jgi:hypothetical protein